MNPSRWEITAPAALWFSWLYFWDRDGWITAAVPSILSHELGHALAVKLLGGRIIRVRLEMTGLTMECTSLPGKAAECAALLTGPLSGLLWSLFARSLPGEFFFRSFQAGLWLNLWNLLPSLSLDGGRILLLLTGSDRLLRVGSILSGSLLLCVSILHHRVGFLPAGVYLILCTLLPESRAATPWHAAPAGKSAPVKRRGSAHSHSG